MVLKNNKKINRKDSNKENKKNTTRENISKNSTKTKKYERKIFKKLEENNRTSFENSLYFKIILLLILLLIDRITKFLVIKSEKIYDFGWIAFRFVENTGAGFGILQNQNTLLIWISIIVLGVLIYFSEKIPSYPLIITISGILGNIIDRISYGAVIDFIDLKFWPVFNMADMYINVGVIIIIIYYIKIEYLEKKKTNHN